MTRWITPIFLLAAMTLAAVAQTEPRSPKIEAASLAAISALYQDVSQQPLTVEMTVGDFIERTKSGEKLLETLRLAEQIGGPRWIDEQTCQIRMAIPGQLVASRLILIAASAPEQSPVKVDTLQATLRNWDRRTFSAVGHSGAMAVVVLPDQATTQAVRVALPSVAPRWAGDLLQADGHGSKSISKLRAARAAEVDALTRLRSQVDALPITDTATLGDAAKSNPRLNAAIDRAVQRARLTKVDYLADGGVNVRASLDLADLWREADSTRNAGTMFAPR